MKETTVKVALGGVFGALAVACLCFSFIPMSEMLMPAAAGVFLIPAVCELGKKWSWVMYAATALLSLLIAPVWESKLLFLFFFGYYPILKGYIESLRRPVWEWVLKLAVFNAAAVLTYWLLLRFFKLDPEVFMMFGLYLPYVVLAVGNLAFILYDRAMSIFFTAYLVKWRPRIAKIFHK